MRALVSLNSIDTLFAENYLNRQLSKEKIEMKYTGIFIKSDDTFV